MQSRRMSFIESTVNTATGFLIAVLTWQFVIPFVTHTPATWSGSVVGTAVFSVVSIARNYMVRRYFTWRA